MLLGGFGGLLALLVVSTLEAYRIQAALSGETLEIYRQHVQHDDTLTRLRRCLWLGANQVRDYLVNPTGDTRAAFHQQRELLETESRELMASLARLPGPRYEAAELSSRVDEFWTVVRAVPESTAALNAAARYEFIRREIAPRRNAVGDLVRNVTELSQRSLHESEAAFARSRRASSQRLFYVLALCLGAGLVVALASIRHSDVLERRNLAQYDLVESSRGELQRLSARLMEVQEEERIRLSRELHDEIGQTVAAFQLELSRAESLPDTAIQEIRTRIATSRVLGARAVRAIRDVCVWLRPTILDDLGLEPALQAHAEEFARRTGVRCEFTAEGLQESLPEAVRTCVYRILQEALHNCEKHADASVATVSVTQSGSRLRLEVRDDGRGFSPPPSEDSQRARFGIVGMRERTETLGGRLEIESDPGRGTRVTAVIPVGQLTDRASSTGASTP